ncbi:hypothetical protein BKA93DRAFT_824246 [Sparassis latifolia]|uniref:arginine--tRNA ligase n=1 Tax=Sparassis crispa TaxID=139825 RepID=A0A401H305_9APHY|nr:hypothetical protein SCP_1401880 [Sparassis crispa]GBE88783.1 hypothetical protein SCP_1401880 [Sparassis crispa]
MLSFEGDPGPYLQYAHVRLCSISRNNPALFTLPPRSQVNTVLLVEPAARDIMIVFLLGSYPDVVKVALRSHEPSGVVTFAFRLSHAISAAWEAVIVKGADVEKAPGADVDVPLHARHFRGCYATIEHHGSGVNVEGLT